MKYLIILVLLVQIISCKEKSEKIDNVVTETKKSVSRNNPSTVLTSKTEIKDSVTKPIPPILLKPEIIKIPKIICDPKSCFNQNLKINNAIHLINSGIENTQWFVVERKKVNYQHRKLDQTDTIG